MTLHTYPGLVQRSEEWYAQRRGIVTASVVDRLITSRAVSGSEIDCPECGAGPGAACTSMARRLSESPTSIKTLHSSRTARAAISNLPPVLEVATGDDARGLTALLAAERITGHTDPTYQSDDMWRGIEDEPRAVDVYSEHYTPVTLDGFMVRDDWGFKIGYSPDGLVGDDGLIEVKSRRQKKQLMTILSGQVPAENMAQLQCGLLVSGRKWIDYISYSGGMHMWTKRVYPEPRWFEAIIAAVEAFEETAARMVAAYNTATEGLPMTERADLEIVI
jgi:hypothetical protein